MKRLPILAVLTVAAALSFNVFAAESDAKDVVDVNVLKLESNTGHFVYASGGPGLIISEVKADGLAGGDPNFGGQLKVGYDWISKKKIGVGFIYSGYFTNFTCVTPKGMKASKTDEDWALNYFGAQFVGRIMLKSPKWSLRYAVGLGLMVSYEGLKQRDMFIGKNYDYGFGFNWSFGITYYVNPNFGINLALSDIEAVVDQQYSGISNTGKIDRLDLDLGVSYRF